MKIKGTVVGGRALGRELGFPTANIRIEEGVQADNGVYAVRVCVEGGVYDGMANLGTRPSVDGGSQRFLEANIFGFEGDLYGREIEVELVKYMRAEVRFPSLDELKAAIAKDRENILAYFSGGASNN